MKTALISIGFTALYLLAMLRPVMPVFDYVINQDYIAEFLCINKDKPELHCDGKCYLMQMLQEQDQQKKDNLPAIDLREYPIGFVQFVQIPPITQPPTAKIQHFIYHNQYDFLQSHRLFHPPSIA